MIFTQNLWMLGFHKLFEVVLFFLSFLWRLNAIAQAIFRFHFHNIAYSLLLIFLKICYCFWTLFHRWVIWAFGIISKVFLDGTFRIYICNMLSETFYLIKLTFETFISVSRHLLSWKTNQWLKMKFQSLNCFL